VDSFACSASGQIYRRLNDPNNPIRNDLVWFFCRLVLFLKKGERKQYLQLQNNLLLTFFVAVYLLPMSGMCSNSVWGMLTTAVW
jgi:hypothetical protein